jgi:hypothetical protein
MKISKPKAPNWRSPQVAALLGAIVVAVIAVPAWAKTDDGLEDEFTLPEAPASGGGGFVARAPEGAPPPPGVTAAMLHAGVPPGAPQRDDEVEPLPPPAELPGGLPPHPPEDNPFPLTDEQIQQQREVLQDYVDCLRDHGQDVGDPEVGPYKIVIPIEADPFSDEFQQARDACGGPPPLIGDEAGESGESDTP